MIQTLGDKVRISEVVILAVSLALGMLLAVAIARPKIISISVGIALVLPLVTFAVLEGGRKAKALIAHLEWWHYLWMLICLSALVFRIRDTSSIRNEPLDLWAIYRILLVTTVAVVLMVRQLLGRSYWLQSMGRGVTGALGIFCLISICSAAWSVYPAWTFYKAVEYTVDVALLSAIIGSVRSAEDYKSLLDWTWVLTALMLGTVWVGALWRPDKAFLADSGIIGSRLSGYIPAVDQDTVGEWAAVLFVVGLARILTRDRFRQIFYWLLLVVCLMTMGLSQARTAIVGCLFGSLIVALFAKGVKPILAIAPIVGLLLWLTVAGTLAQRYWERGDSDETRQGFTGRLDVWQYGFEMFLKQPFIGYGAYAGGRFAAVASSANDPNQSNTLSDYVEIALGTGLAGLIPFTIAVASTWILLCGGLRRSECSGDLRRMLIEGVGVLGVMTVESFFSAELMWHPAQLFFVAVGLAEVLRRGFLRAASGLSTSLQPISEKSHV